MFKFRRNAILLTVFDPWLVGSTDVETIAAESLLLGGVVRILVAALIPRLNHPASIGR